MPVAQDRQQGPGFQRSVETQRHGYTTEQRRQKRNDQQRNEKIPPCLKKDALRSIERSFKKIYTEDPISCQPDDPTDLSKKSKDQEKNKK